MYLGPFLDKRDKCSAIAEMGDRVTTVAFLRRVQIFLLTYLLTIDMGRKFGGCAALWGAAGSLSNTMWPGPRPTSVPNGILIHPAVCPQ